MRSAAVLASIAAVGRLDAAVLIVLTALPVLAVFTEGDVFAFAAALFIRTALDLPNRLDQALAASSRPAAPARVLADSMGTADAASTDLIRDGRSVGFAESSKAIAPLTWAAAIDVPFSSL